MDVRSLQYLTSSAICQELALRSREFLHYRHPSIDVEQQQIAEACFFNLMVEYINCAGLPRHEAEQFCEDPNNLMELAMRIHSLLA